MPFPSKNMTSPLSTLNCVTIENALSSTLSRTSNGNYLKVKTLMVVMKKWLSNQFQEPIIVSLIEYKKKNEMTSKILICICY